MCVWEREKGEMKPLCVCVCDFYHLWWSLCVGGCVTIICDEAYSISTGTGSVPDDYSTSAATVACLMWLVQTGPLLVALWRIYSWCTWWFDPLIRIWLSGFYPFRRLKDTAVRRCLTDIIETKTIFWKQRRLSWQGTHDTFVSNLWTLFNNMCDVWGIWWRHLNDQAGY